MEHLIRQYSDWRTADPADIVAWLQEPITTTRSNRINANDLFKMLGTENACRLAAALNEAGLGLVNQSIAAIGIDFGDEETQRMLTKLAEDNPTFSPYAAGLLALGQYTATRWDRARMGGATPPPTEDEVAALIEQIKNSEAKDVVRAWRNDVLLPLVDLMTNNGNTIEEIKAEIAK